MTNKHYYYHQKPPTSKGDGHHYKVKSTKSPLVKSAEKAMPTIISCWEISEEQFVLSFHELEKLIEQGLLKKIK